MSSLTPPPLSWRWARSCSGISQIRTSIPWCEGMQPQRRPPSRLPTQPPARASAECGRRGACGRLLPADPLPCPRLGQDTICADARRRGCAGQWPPPAHFAVLPSLTTQPPPPRYARCRTNHQHVHINPYMIAHLNDSWLFQGSSWANFFEVRRGRPIRLCPAATSTCTWCDHRAAHNPVKEYCCSVTHQWVALGVTVPGLGCTPTATAHLRPAVGT